MKQQKIRLIFVALYIGVTLTFLMLALTSCKNPIPKINTFLWAGDSDREGITRAQDHLTISCGEPAFNDYVCLTYNDLTQIYRTFFKCKDWGETPVSIENKQQFIDLNKDVHQKLYYSKNFHHQDDLEPSPSFKIGN